MFGTEFDLANLSFLMAAVAALAGGTLSFLSPCVLPIVPPYLAYMGGISLGDMQDAGTARRKLVLPALFFVLGLSTVFLVLGFAASSLGRLFLQQLTWLNLVSGIMVIVLGLHFLNLLRIPFLDREARMDVGDRGGTAMGAFVLGLAFAFGWAPCMGPILAAILTLAADSESLTRGTALLGIYAVGLGLPFLAAAMFIGPAIGMMKRLRPHMGKIEKSAGVLLIVVGVALLTGSMTAASFWLLETFPFLGKIG